jgi:hypothetical protein
MAVTQNLISGRKKLFCLIVFLISSQSIFSQVLTLFDLTYLLEHDIESSDTYITEKGFRYDEVKKGENGKCDAMFWSYNRNPLNNKSVAYISKYCFEANYGFIWYQLIDKLTFDKIKRDCKSKGFKLVNTEVNELNNYSAIFENNEYKIKFTSGLDSTTKRNFYIINLQGK